MPAADDLWRHPARHGRLTGPINTKDRPRIPSRALGLRIRAWAGAQTHRASVIECDFLKFCLDLFLKAPSPGDAAPCWHRCCPAMNQRQDLSSIQGERGRGQRSRRTHSNFGAKVRWPGLSLGWGRGARNHRCLWEPRAPWRPPHRPQLGTGLYGAPGAVQVAHRPRRGIDAASDQVASGDHGPRAWTLGQDSAEGQAAFSAIKHGVSEPV